jgi:hypothetical protein
MTIAMATAPGIEKRKPRVTRRRQHKESNTHTTHHQVYDIIVSLRAGKSKY